MASSLQFFLTRIWYTFPLSPILYMPLTFHSLSLDHPNNMWTGLQILMSLITLFHSSSCYSFPLYVPSVFSIWFPNTLSLCVRPTFWLSAMSSVEDLSPFQQRCVTQWRQILIDRNPWPMILPNAERTICTTIQNNRHNYSFTHFKLYVFR